MAPAVGRPLGPDDLQVGGAAGKPVDPPYLSRRDLSVAGQAHRGIYASVAGRTQRKK